MVTQEMYMFLKKRKKRKNGDGAKMKKGTE